MPHILLTGAGFSHNWGGWLADEALEYLLGHPRIDDGLRRLLWQHKGKGGFEAAYHEQKTATVRHFSVAMLDHSQRFDEAIGGMFADMNREFSKMESLEFHSTASEYRIGSFLLRFDAIFTLNQDVLLEQHYLTSQFPNFFGTRYAVNGMDGRFPGCTKTQTTICGPT